MADEQVYRVRIKHNVVIAIERTRREDNMPVGETNLQIGAQLARNNLQNGCLDGDYFFDGANGAKEFALVSIDFLQKLLGKAQESIDNQNFHTSPDWTNPIVGHGGVKG